MVYNGQNIGMLIPKTELEFILEALNLFLRRFYWIKPLDCACASRIITSLKYSPRSTFTNDVGRSISSECTGEDKRFIQLLFCCRRNLNLDLYLKFVNRLDGRSVYNLLITNNNKSAVNKMSESDTT